MYRDPLGKVRTIERERLGWGREGMVEEIDVTQGMKCRLDSQYKGEDSKREGEIKGFTRKESISIPRQRVEEIQ